MFVALLESICAIRSVRGNVGPRGPTVVNAVRMVQRVLLLEDRDAEDALLHNVHVVKTQDPRDKAIIPYSLEFESLA